MPIIFDGSSKWKRHKAAPLEGSTVITWQSDTPSQCSTIRLQTHCIFYHRLTHILRIILFSKSSPMQSMMGTKILVSMNSVNIIQAVPTQMDEVLVDW